MNNTTADTIKISAVTIVKNEAKNIGFWLNSVKHYADEIIIVDTGSEDDTLSIAAAAGAKVAHFSWCDDFSAAKNYAIDLCCGQWIAFLDADEYFSVEDAKKIRPLLNRLTPNPKIVGVVTPLKNIDTDNNNAILSTTHQLRLFRHLRDIRYTGRVHEHLTGIDSKGREAELAEDVSIYHTGYSKSIFHAKCARNLQLLQSEIERRGHMPGDYSYLSDCYSGLDDYDKAIYYAEKHIASGDQAAGEESTPHINIIRAHFYREDPTSVILPVINRAISRFPDNPAFLFYAGLCFYRDGDLITSAHYIDDGLTIFNSHRTANISDLITSSNRGESTLPRIYMVRGRIYEAAGYPENARRCYHSGITASPYQAGFLTIFLRALAEYGSTAADIRSCLSDIYTLSDNNFIVDSITPLMNMYPVLAELYISYRPESNFNNPDLYSELARGNYTTAATMAAVQLEDNLRRGLSAAIATELPHERARLSLYAPPNFHY